jgi:hypothetical protein
MLKVVSEMFGDLLVSGALKRQGGVQFFFGESERPGQWPEEMRIHWKTD